MFFAWLIDPYVSSTYEEATVILLFYFDSTSLAEKLTVLQIFRLMFDFLTRKLTACLKPLSRDGLCKAFYPRTQQNLPECGLNPDHVIKIAVKTTLLPFRPRCRQDQIFFDFFRPDWKRYLNIVLLKHFASQHFQLNNLI